VTHLPTSDKPIIVVDIDGVLFETTNDTVTAVNKEHGTAFTVTDLFNHHAEHDKSKLVINGEDQYHKLQHNVDQYREVDGAKQVLERLSTRAQIIALTSRNYDKFFESTQKVIGDRFGEVISEVYFTTQPSSDQHREKGEIVKELGGAILIDDAVKYCESAIKYGIPAVLISQPYNKVGHDYPKDFTASNWQEAAEIIERVLDKVNHK